ncbi:MAG TPA: hypothetical protein DG577_08090, partial [Firmicutes bacterium]|nr:hypothetical protein [Bacillota bacterium]
MDKRGSALLNVLIVTAVLMILGALLLQVVAADVKLSRKDYNRADALQLAEGGIDYAIERIAAAGTTGLLGIHTFDLENVSVELENITDPNYIGFLGYQEYRVTSTAVQDNSTRTIEVKISHNPFSGPFEYSVYVGGKNSTNLTVDLKNESAIERPVVICTENLELKNVIFNETVIINSRTAVLGPDVQFNNGVYFVDCTVTSLNNTGYTVLPADSEFYVGLDYLQNFVYPKVDISYFADNPQFTTWEKGVLSPWQDTGEIQMVNLSSRNYFPDTVVIKWDTNSNFPSPLDDNTLVIVSEGDIRMDGVGNIDHESYSLILIAGGDVIGPNYDVVKNIQVPLYIYAGKDIKCGNNLSNLRSTIALGHLMLGSGMSSFHDFFNEIPALTEA